MESERLIQVLYKRSISTLLKLFNFINIIRIQREGKFAFQSKGISLALNRHGSKQGSVTNN